MEKKRRRTIVLILFAVLSALVSLHSGSPPPDVPNKQTLRSVPEGSTLANIALNQLEIKGRAPKTGYTRAQFLSDWGNIGGCDLRNLVLKRDLNNVFIDPIDKCRVIRGTLNDPYTGKTITFERGKETSNSIQIDHVVALSDSWQTGAQKLSFEERNKFGNDPLNLLAVDGPANQQKSDGDAATWLPPNKSYRCRYVARQVAVKLKYHLWVTPAEKDAINRQLHTCPDQVLPIGSGL